MTVVCVEPNLIVLHSLKRKVRKIMPNASVYMFRNTKDALDSIRKNGCDVLITEIDFGSEMEEGIVLATKAMDYNAQLNIIFVTARSAKDYAQQLVRIKYSGFLTKPFDMDELAGELDSLRYG